jgi:hypothetical protein
MPKTQNRVLLAEVKKNRMSVATPTSDTCGMTAENF